MSYRVDDLSREVMAELHAYCDEVTEAVKAEVDTVAEECLQEIKANSPVRTGRYRKGWRKEVAFESRDDIRISVRFQSTSSARRTTAAYCVHGDRRSYFNPRPPRGGRRRR